MTPQPPRTHFFNSLLRLRWLAASVGLLIGLALWNRFPEGMVYAGADAFQIFNFNWVRQTAQLWSHWSGEGEFSVGFFYYPFYAALGYLTRLFPITPSEQSVIYFLFYWLGSYCACLLSLCWIKQNPLPVFSWEANGLAMCYGLNPFTYFIFYSIWGFGPFYFLYPLFPVLLVASIEYLSCIDRRRNFQYCLILFITFLLATIGYGNLAFCIALNLVLTGIALLIFYLHRTWSWVYFGKKWGTLIAIECLASGWAIFPQLQFWLFESSPISNNKIFNFREWILWQRLSFSEIFTLDPYAFSGSGEPSLTYGFGVIFFLLFIYCLLQPKLRRSTRVQILAIASLIILAALIESKGKGIIPGEWAISLFTNPLLGALRSNGKLILFLPFLLIYGLALVLPYLSLSQKKVCFSLLLVCNALSIYPIFTGQMETRYSSIFKKNEDCSTAEYCYLNRIPTDYQQAAQTINQDGLKGKILSAPFSVINSPGWANFPAWKHVGADPTRQLFSLPVVQMNAFGSFGMPYGLEWANKGLNEVESIIGRCQDLGISYILFHKDVAPRFIEPSLSLFKTLEKKHFLSTIFESQWLIVFKLANPFLRPAISYNLLESSPQADLSIPFVEINPTKYLIYLPFNENRMQVNLRETYSNQWQLLMITNHALVNDFGHAPPWWKSFSYPNPSIKEHTLFGGYGNGWVINPVEACKKIACSIVDLNGKKYVAALIEYSAQRWVIFFGILTILSALILIPFWIISIFRIRTSVNH